MLVEYAFPRPFWPPASERAIDQRVGKPYTLTILAGLPSVAMGPVIFGILIPRHAVGEHFGAPDDTMKATF